MGIGFIRILIRIRLGFVVRIRIRYRVKGLDNEFNWLGLGLYVLGYKLDQWAKNYG